MRQHCGRDTLEQKSCTYQQNEVILHRWSGRNSCASLFTGPNVSKAEKTGLLARWSVSGHLNAYPLIWLDCLVGSLATRRPMESGHRFEAVGWCTWILNVINLSRTCFRNPRSSWELGNLALSDCEKLGQLKVKVKVKVLMVVTTFVVCVFCCC